MWLMKRLAPDFKTIANFRKIKSDALTAVGAAFVDFARRQNLVDADLVAIDGTKVHAAASKRAVTNPGKLRERQLPLCEAIDRYMTRLDDIDEAEQRPAQEQSQVLRSDLVRLEQQRQQADHQAAELAASGKKYLVTTDPDARLMRCGAGSFMPAYNLQVAVDTRHCLIIHQALCQDANDTLQPWPMAHASRCCLERDRLSVVANAGYSNVAQIKACEQDGILTYLPTQRGNKSGGNDRYPSAALRYDRANDSYLCPQGHQL